MLGPNRVAFHSSYLSIARRAGLCHHQCQGCDCVNRVAGILNGLGVPVENVLNEKTIPPDLLNLLKTSERQGSDVLSPPDDTGCGHVNVMRIHGLILEKDCSDDEL